MAPRAGSTAPDSNHLAYRGDIDGLRAVAVLSVVIYHAFPGALPGGFIGVDIFFVISGFLISSILLGSLGRGTFTFTDFYLRRVRRIFPALVLVLATCGLMGWFILTPSDYRMLGKHIVSGAGFVSNLVLWSESDYFDVAAEMKPLLHLWSLGVEEQFYLIWPLALWGAWKARLSTRVMTIVIIVVSFAHNLWMMKVDATGAFFSPATRFWELLSGALLAQAAARSATPGSRAWPWLERHRSAVADSQSVLGLIAIATGLALINKTMAFPGWIAAIPVFGAVMIIAAGPGALVNRLLSLAPMVFIGVISYPLYLWHWPVLSFARLSGLDPASLPVGLALVGLSILLAWATYRIVERPVRSGSMRTTAWTLASLMTLAAVGGGVTFAKDGFESRYSEDLAAYANFKYEYQTDGRYHKCWLNDKAAPDGFAPECVDSRPGHLARVVVWGDSHAARLFPGLVKVTGDSLNLAQFTRDACPPFAGMAYPNCIAGNAYVLGRIRDLHPETVLLFGYWTHHMQPDRAAAVAQLDGTVASLKAIGVRNVIVLGPAPQWTTTLPNTVVQLVKSKGLDRVPRRTSFGLDPAAQDLDTYLQAHFAGRDDVKYFSVRDALCDGGGCLTRTGDTVETLTSWDYGHLTTPGAEYVARALSLDANGFRAR